VSPEFDNQTEKVEAEVAGSWKEIAAFFGVSVRTVQLWEEERGLPVRRHPGGRGRVFAYISELQAWREGGSDSQSGSAAAPAPAPAPGPQTFARNRWVSLAAVALLLIAVALLGALKIGPRIPSSLRLAGQSLIVSDQEGRTLWAHRFDSEVMASWETNVTYSRPIFSDIDGDGEIELLFPFSPNAPWGARNGALYCFSSSGSIRWIFNPDRTVYTKKGRFAPPYDVRLLALVPGTPGSAVRIFVASTHFNDCPSQAALLDVNGGLLREYWHSGHFTSVLVTDLVPGGGPEIYLGAISNAARRASIIALDPRDFQGSAREENSDYRILGFPPTREIVRVLLPRLKASESAMFDAVNGLARSGPYLVVSAGQFTKEAAVYQALFDSRLNLADVTISSTTYLTYRNLYDRGLLPFDNPDRELPELRKIRYLTRFTQETARNQQ